MRIAGPAEIENEARLEIAAFKTPDDIEARLFVDESRITN